MKQQSSFGPILKTISKVISWIIFVVLLCAAIFLVYYYIATKIYEAKGPGYEPKFSIYTIISGSMIPNIKVYDTVINAKVEKDTDIVKGDVITFVSSSLLSPGATITHRVLAVTRDENGKICYQTKGDNNPVPDQGCTKFNNVIGRVIFKIPQLGRIQFFLASKVGWLLCIVIPAAVIIIRDIMRITKLKTIKDVTVNEKTKKKDSVREKMELERKKEIKRKLKDIQIESNYYEDPEIITIDKRKKNNSKK